MSRTRISIDYGLCGDGIGVDPRDCGACLRICRPAVFLLHQTIGAEEEDPHDPQKWRVTPMWLTLCTRCGECVAVCPVQAIRVSPEPRHRRVAQSAPHPGFDSEPDLSGGSGT